MARYSNTTARGSSGTAAAPSSSEQKQAATPSGVSVMSTCTAAPTDVSHVTCLSPLAHAENACMSQVGASPGRELHDETQSFTKSHDLMLAGSTHVQKHAHPTG